MLTAKPARKVIVFWTAQDRTAWIGSELLAGRLRQGWGISGSALTENGVILPFAIWSQRFAPSALQQWSWKADVKGMSSRHGILSRMIGLKKGDLVIVPKVPSANEFTIAQVAGGYCFDDKHFTEPVPGTADFGHVMQVDPKTLITRTYHSSPEARGIAAKLHHYRSAVNNVQDTDYANMILTFYDRATGNGA